MNRPADLVTFATYDAEITKLFALLEKLGIEVPRTADIKQDAYTAFSLLYYHVFADERPEGEAGVDLAKTQAGLGDIAAKINRAAATGDPKDFEPHLREMIKGSALMNAASPANDQSANKTSEFYLGCLAMSAGFKVDLEDPVASAGGANPDLLFTDSGEPWAIAVKTIHGDSNRTIYDNIKSGAKQINRTGRPGIVFLNMKNRIDKPGIVEVDRTFTTPDEAVSALTSALASLSDGVRTDNVDDDWRDVFEKSSARPIIAFMGQTVLAADVGGRPLWVPIRAIKVLRVPPAPPKPQDLVGLDAKAVSILERLNHELQWNPPAPAP